MVCPRCGTKNKNNAARCAGCGSRMLSGADAVKSPGDVDTISLLSEHPELAEAAAKRGIDLVNNSPSFDHEEYAAPQIVYKYEHKTVYIVLNIVFACILTAAGFLFGTLVNKSNQFDARSSLERAENMMSEGNYGIAENEYGKVLETDPKNIEAIIGSAACLKAKGDADNAVAVLKKGYELTKSKIIEIYISDPGLL